YVPVDPVWPALRLGYVLEDCSAAALVAPAAMLQRLEFAGEKIDPAFATAGVAVEGMYEAPRTVEPESLAYLIYTSGSTGSPKGVEITHANLSHLISWHVEAFKVSEVDRASHLAGLGFDAAVWEIWPTLAAGATLCLPDSEEIRWSPELIHRWLLREQVTIGFVPTVHAGPLMKMSWPDSTRLRSLLTGGDVLPSGPATELPFAVFNQYGPSECTVVTTSAMLSAGMEMTPPIGRPIAGAAVYLLDHEGRQVSKGQVGEMYIGGDGVGRSYRNQPHDPPACFLPDPYSKRAGARMYRSGDLAAWREDGQLEFRGRRDRQVKLNGQRLELDEIGSVLSRHPAIAFAAVTLKTNQEGKPQLVAYVLMAAGHGRLTEGTLQTYLAERLPWFMVPSVFLQLDRIPLGTNGKLELSTLPEPETATRLERMPPKERLRPTAAKVLRIVQTVLHRENFAVDDNFFLAGGHSLLGMQLTIQLRKEFGVGVALRHLFHMATVEKLAVFIETKVIEERLTRVWQRLLNVETVPSDANFLQLGGGESVLPKLQRKLMEEFGQHIPLAELRRASSFREQSEILQGPRGHTGPPPAGVSFLQPDGERDGLFWASYPGETLVKALGKAQPSIFLSLTDEDMKRLDPAPSLEDFAALMLRKLFAVQPVGPYHLGGVCIGGVVAYEMARQLQAAGQDVGILVLLDSPSPGFYGIPDLFGPRLREPLYLLKRLARLGARNSMLKVGERILRHVPERVALHCAKPFPQLVQDMDPLEMLLQSAAASYSPPACKVNSLLILAEDRPRHLDFLPGWRSLLGGSLEVERIAAHHSRITRLPAADMVA
ncbi:MAG: AMP-binding protein, partial [Rhodospirillales bacterium]|nr:AMP-binding protein [Acetobacter sp.]